jgi:hypothetical protein
MLTHVLVSVGHTVGHLVCNGGAGYLRKVPALFKVKVNPLPHVFSIVWCLYALVIGLLQHLLATNQYLSTLDLSKFRKCL